MDIVEIPDDFYIYEEDGYRFLCHKSCVLVNDTYSNNKFSSLMLRLVSDEDIILLRIKCNMIDEIEERTHFVSGRFKKLLYNICRDGHIELAEIYFPSTFNNVNDFIDYLDKNHPECIKSVDIKIALKD